MRTIYHKLCKFLILAVGCWCVWAMRCLFVCFQQTAKMLKYKSNCNFFFSLVFFFVCSFFVSAREDSIIICLRHSVEEKCPEPKSVLNCAKSRYLCVRMASAYSYVPPENVIFHTIFMILPLRNGIFAFADTKRISKMKTNCQDWFSDGERRDKLTEIQKEMLFWMHWLDLRSYELSNCEWVRITFLETFRMSKQSKWIVC